MVVETSTLISPSSPPPYEEITKEVYEEMMKTFPDLTHLPELVNIYERDEFEEDELEAECAG